jgi:hypothetical protein
MVRRVRRLAAVSALASIPLAGCSGSDGSTSGGGAAGPTYYADAKPILDAKCGKCHVEGGIAPFALTTYADANEHKAAIKSAVEARTMPPWPPASDCNTYLNDRSLDDDQIATLGAWVDAGGQEGDASNPAPPLDVGDARALSRVDLEIGMDAAYTMTTTPDEYRCFVLDWPETERVFVTGLGVKPGNAAVVHHVIAFIEPPEQLDEVQALDDADPGPGYQCFGGPGNRADWLGAWVPGSTGYDYPDGTGIAVEPGSKIVMQVHYNSATAGAEPDQTRVELKLDPSVDKEAHIQPWANPQWLTGGMDIPAATKGVSYDFALDATKVVSNDQPFVIYTAMLHMHQLGRSARLSVDRAAGGEQCLLDIPSWNFHWQGSYPLAETVTFQPGDKMHLECTWDNDTMTDVAWGEGTTDEMCLGGFYYTLP